jgi:hypothetical protein
MPAPAALVALPRRHTRNCPCDPMLACRLSVVSRFSRPAVGLRGPSARAQVVEWSLLARATRDSRRGDSMSDFAPDGRSGRRLLIFWQEEVLHLRPEQDTRSYTQLRDADPIGACERYRLCRRR